VQLPAHGPSGCMEKHHMHASACRVHQLSVTETCPQPAKLASEAPAPAEQKLISDEWMWVAGSQELLISCQTSLLQQVHCWCNNLVTSLHSWYCALLPVTVQEEAKRLSEALGNKLLLKREDLQPVFSFKLRGAYNKVCCGTINSTNDMSALPAFRPVRIP
jgi:hypothetical protein